MARGAAKKEPGKPIVIDERTKAVLKERARELTFQLRDDPTKTATLARALERAYRDGYGHGVGRAKPEPASTGETPG